MYREALDAAAPRDFTMAQGLWEVYKCRIVHQNGAHWESDFTSRKLIFICDDLPSQVPRCIVIHHAHTHNSSWLQCSVICRDFKPIQTRSLECSCCVTRESPAYDRIPNPIFIFKTKEASLETAPAGGAVACKQDKPKGPAHRAVKNVSGPVGTE